MIATVLEVLGLVLVVAGAYLIWLPLAPLLAGVALVFLAQGLDS